MCQQEACMDLLLGKMRFVQRKEVANVVGDQRPTELCRRHEHGSVSGAEELVMLGLDRLDIPPGPAELDPDLRVQHLVEEELQGWSACWRRCHSWWARSASSRLSATSRSISPSYSP